MSNRMSANIRGEHMNKRELLNDFFKWLDGKGFVIAAYLEGNKKPIELSDKHSSLITAYLRTKRK